MAPRVYICLEMMNAMSMFTLLYTVYLYAPMH